ncbi:MAG TPA: aminotransferase class III-fold pyridoxal phosphate-dependent enzyme [Spirochaetia bacterium]|nr:aminotransferase class III-fold pyridoxal phosphate-dependent enzyme [Spirochaetia bacterium]
MIETTNLVQNPPFPKNYASEMLRIERGRGVDLWDAAGKRYLDLGAGIAVNALGYGRRDLAKIAARQMRRLIHISNLYATAPAIDLANLLLDLTRQRGNHFAAVQFGNSGAEANEAALKYARLYAYRTRGPGHHKILSLSNAFHGRTMGALSATPNKKYSEPFEPLVPDMLSCDYNDPDQVEAVVNDSFAAIIVEVIQGEGGLRVMSREFASRLNELCAKHDVLLIADEVQTGLGRTGRLFGSELVGLKPDMMTFSKPLAGGLPLSATMVPEKVNTLLHPGDHGTTFGGGPVTASVAAHVVRTIAAPDFLASVEKLGGELTAMLDDIVASSSEVEDRRGLGMLQGIAIRSPEGSDDASGRVAEIMNACRERGVLLLRSSSNVVRIAPPLVISSRELARGIGILKEVLWQTR